MKLQLYKNENISETEIDIRYNTVDKPLERVILYIEQQEHFIEGVIDNNLYHISLNDILYFEIIDRKTFIYTQDNVYECKKNLLTLEQELIGTTVIRIGKNVLLNLSFLKCVQPYPNHRLLAILENKEKLIVSRKYISVLQEKIRGLYYA